MSGNFPQISISLTPLLISTRRYLQTRLLRSTNWTVDIFASRRLSSVPILLSQREWLLLSAELHMITNQLARLRVICCKRILSQTILRDYLIVNQSVRRRINFKRRCKEGQVMIRDFAFRGGKFRILWETRGVLRWWWWWRWINRVISQVTKAGLGML